LSLTKYGLVICIITARSTIQIFGQGCSFIFDSIKTHLAINKTAKTVPYFQSTAGCSRPAPKNHSSPFIYQGVTTLFQNEFEFDETITTVIDDNAIYEDIQLIIDDNEVFIRQWNETLQRYDLIMMSHKMFFELQQALKHTEGLFRTELK
jgi:hypothetical protein